MGGGYEEIGSYGDMQGQNLNPYTAGTMSGLQTQGADLWKMLQGLSPDQLMKGLSQNATGMSDVASKLMGGYTAASDSAAMAKAREGVRGTLNEFSGGNSLYSGAAGIGTERSAAIPWLEALTNQSQMQSQLAGQGMGMYGNAWNTQYQGLSNMFNANQANQAGLSQWDQYEPQYGYKQGFWDYAAPILGGAAGGAAGAATAKWFG